MNITIKIEVPRQPHLAATFRYVTVKVGDTPEVTHLHKGTSITAVDYAQKMLEEQVEFTAARENEWNQRLTQ